MENSRIYIVGAAGIFLAVIASLVWIMFSDPAENSSSAIGSASQEHDISATSGSIEDEVAALKRENKRLQERINNLTTVEPPEEEPGLKVPKNAKEAGTIIGNLMRARFDMQERWPDGAPDKNSPEYTEWLAARQQMAEGFASMILVGTVMRDSTPEQQIEFGTSQLATSLELSEADTAAANAVLEARKDELTLTRDMIPKDSEERRAFFASRVKALQDTKTAVMEVLPAPQAQLMDKMYDPKFMGRGMFDGR